MTYSRYYVVKPPQPKCPPTPHHVMMKCGIHGQNKENSEYIRHRYGPGSELFAGYTFTMSLRDLDKTIEKPDLEILNFALTKNTIRVLCNVTATNRLPGSTKQYPRTTSHGGCRPQSLPRELPMPARPLAEGPALRRSTGCAGPLLP